MSSNVAIDIGDGGVCVRSTPHAQRSPARSSHKCANASAMMGPPSVTAQVPAVSADSIVLPPPSATHPLPVLTAALRLDNLEQVVNLLRTDPNCNWLGGGGGSAAAAGPNSNSSGTPFRQVLVFSNSSLRTLIMRQVLSDPHSRTWKGKKINWDVANIYPITAARGLHIVGTQVLSSSASSPSILPTVSPSSSSLQLQQPQLDISAEGQGHVVQDTLSQADSSLNETDIDLMNPDVITYFLRPCDIAEVQQVANRIRKKQRSGGTSSSSIMIHHRLIFLPTTTALLTKVLGNLGLNSTIFPNCSIHKCQLDVFPIETDVLSLEYDSALKESLVESTPSQLIVTTARSIMKLQDVVGQITRIQAYGPLAEDVLRKLLNMTVDEYLASDDAAAAAAASSTMDLASSSVIVEPGDVAALVILDRKVDLITPLLTPLTYEGLLDDVVVGGIDVGFIHVPLDTINPDDETEKNGENDGDAGSTGSGSKKSASSNNKKQSTSVNKHELVTLGLNGSSDSLYAEVRDQHVEKFGSFLQNQAKALQASHASFTSQGKRKDLSEIHQFVKQIPIFTQNLRSLTNHIHLAELVKRSSEEPTFREQWQLERSMLEGELCLDQLDDLIASQYPPWRLLRLLCLQSLTAGGIKSSRYDSFRRDIVQTYGYEFLFVLHSLEKAGLLSRREGLWMDAVATSAVSGVAASSSSFGTLRKLLILIHPEVDTVEPDDVSYVSSGYAPLSVRLLQTSMKGWYSSSSSTSSSSSSGGMGGGSSSVVSGVGGGTSGADRLDILRELPGRLIDVQQRWPPQDLATSLKLQQQQQQSNRRGVGGNSSGTPLMSLGAWAKSVKDAETAGNDENVAAAASSSSSLTTTRKRKPVLMILYVGGVTYMELASLRFLSKRPTFPYHIVCVTTKIINGCSFLQSLSEMK